MLLCGVPLEAFDTVNHDILIQKLSYYGFRGNSQKLIKSFSHKSQTEFLIYINDLRLSLKCSTASHFADDTCIIYQS